MNKKTLFIIFTLIVLVIFYSVSYNKKTNLERDISDELRKHHTALISIVGDIEKYNKYSNDIKYVDKIYIKYLLRIPREFEICLDSYNDAYSKKIKKNDVEGITNLINDYYDLFIKSVSLINEVDYEALNMIKNDFEKWGIWIEENYIFTDKNGYTAYKVYTYDDMIKSGLLDELTLVDFQR